MMPWDVIAVDLHLFFSTYRLPVPWLLWTLINYPNPFIVSSDGVGCSIALLFLMLVLVFLSIVFFKWKMTKPMGIFMGLLYIVFVIISVGLEECWFACPIRV